MEPPALTRSQTRQAILFAILGNLVPLALAAAGHDSADFGVFFAGVFLAALAPVVVVLAPRRSAMRFVFALSGVPALTAMQAYSGGVGSRYAVLLLMPTIWFGVQARRPELIGGIVVLALCCFVPMLVFGAPAYPVDWAQATLVFVIASAVVGSLSTVSRETRRLTAALREQALLDDLTGLLNRRGWAEATSRELARARRAGSAIGVVAIDLDALKEANDTMGHDEGDRLIRETAERMRTAFRAEDVIARLGGDEFSVLLVDSNADDVIGAVSRLRAQTPASAAFSAGVVLAAADESMVDLQRRADLALYEAKRGGGRDTVLAGPALPSYPD